MSRELADLVDVMPMGRIEQMGRSAEFRAKPATDFVPNFTATSTTGGLVWEAG